jgi:hypothetical protein
MAAKQNGMIIEISTPENGETPAVVRRKQRTGEIG